LNKYFPPDFDPAELPKRKRPKDGQIRVRVMLPFTCQCHTCGEFIYRGRKFTSRQEFAPEKYLTIPIFRFYIKCPSCCAEITFKTDPEHADYICELGATRHFEPYRQDDARLDFFKKPEDREDAPDPMKTLENRTKASKREMDILDSLEEIKELNARNSKRDLLQVIAIRNDKAKELEKEKEEEDAVIKEVFGSDKALKRLEDEDETELSTTSKKVEPAEDVQVKSEDPEPPVVKKEENNISLPSSFSLPTGLVLVKAKKKEKNKPKKEKNKSKKGTKRKVKGESEKRKKKHKPKVEETQLMQTEPVIKLEVPVQG